MAEYEWVRNLDLTGSGEQNPVEPLGLAMYDNAGTLELYVCDNANTCVLVFNAITGAFLRKIGGPGEGDGQFTLPLRVAVVDDMVFVADLNANRMQRFSLTGEFQMKWGSYGSDPGTFNGLTDVCAYGGSIYTICFWNCRIQKWSYNGEWLGAWGSSGTGDEQLQFPKAFSIVGDLFYIYDQWLTPNGGGVKVWDLEGNFIRKWQVSSTDNAAWGISVWYNQVWVAVTEEHQLRVYSPAGDLFQTIGSQGSGNGQFESPFATAHRSPCYALIADRYNNRVQEFNAPGLPFPILFRSASGDNGIPNPAIPRPAGLQAGDVMLAFIGSNYNCAPVPVNAEWTYLRYVTIYQVHLWVFVRVATESEPDEYTWQKTKFPEPPSFAAHAAVIAAYSGVSSATPVNTHDGRTVTSTTQHPTPELTTTVSGAMLVAAWSLFNYGGGAIPPATYPAEMTLRRNEVCEGVPPQVWAWTSVCDVLQAAAGPTGEFTLTTEQAVDFSAIAMVALTPATGGGQTARIRFMRRGIVAA